MPVPPATIFAHPRLRIPWSRNPKGAEGLLVVVHGGEIPGPWKCRGRGEISLCSLPMPTRYALRAWGFPKGERKSPFGRDAPTKRCLRRLASTATIILYRRITPLMNTSQSRRIHIRESLGVPTGDGKFPCKVSVVLPTHTLCLTLLGLLALLLRITQIRLISF